MNGFIPIIDQELQRDPQCSRVARAAIRAEFLDGPLRDSLEVIASELVTNAFVHGSGNIQYKVFSSDRRYRIEVSNYSTAGELDISEAPPTADSEGGRGLEMVRSLSTDFGYTFSSNRLTFWAELAKPSEKE
jgi:anti-sigma regulatory factor (Ser/Thr protein kinase)